MLAREEILGGVTVGEVWNGVKWSDEDLDVSVSNFSALFQLHFEMFPSSSLAVPLAPTQFCVAVAVQVA